MNPPMPAAGDAAGGKPTASGMTQAIGGYFFVS
jgi:hypothetical protein